MRQAVQRGLQLAEDAKANSWVCNGTHSGAVTVTTVGTKVVYTMQLSCTEQNEVFCATGRQRQPTGGFR